MPVAEPDVTLDFSRMERLEEELAAAQQRELRLATLDLLGEAVKDAPVHEGTLRGSGTAHFQGQQIAAGPAAAGATPMDGAGGSDQTTATVVFNTEYAAAQHEGVEYAHPQGGKAKYLADALTRGAGSYLQRIAAAGARALQGGG